MRFVIRRVLWTLVPIGSLGLLGWVPPLRIALRRKTPAAWLWFAGAVAATVLECAVSGTAQTRNAQGGGPAWVGLIDFACMLFMAVYTGVATRALTPKPSSARTPLRVQDAYPYDPGYGPGHGYGYGRYPAQPAAYPEQPAAYPEQLAAYPEQLATYPAQPAAYPAPSPVDAPSLAPTVVTSPLAPPVVASSVMPPVVAPNAADAAAAEVQAELRQLRDFLDESAGGRAREKHDRRGEW